MDSNQYKRKAQFILNDIKSEIYSEKFKDDQSDVR